ncbi:hypothetical protein [Klebsiella quasipneumoniae]
MVIQLGREYSNNISVNIQYPIPFRLQCFLY